MSQYGVCIVCRAEREKSRQLFWDKNGSIVSNVKFGTTENVLKLKAFLMNMQRYLTSVNAVFELVLILNDYKASIFISETADRE